MKFKINKVLWNKRMQNLRNRRSTGHVGNRTLPTYCEILSKVDPGTDILDVGCGSMPFKDCIKNWQTYTGIDAFPVNDTVKEMQIENCKFLDKSFDTVLCFAVLDGLHDLEAATQHMKRVARKNVIFLTGIDIEPDEYHTFKITEELLNELMEWPIEHKEYLTNRVMLISYARP